MLIAIIDDLDRWEVGLDRLHDDIGGEGRLRRRKIAREPDGDFAFDADADEIKRCKRDAAVVNAACEYPPAQGCGMARYCCIISLVQPILYPTWAPNSATNRSCSTS
jgi:hypothetical protein